MPGFSIDQASSSNPNALAEVRRKHRWLWTIDEPSDMRRIVVYLQKSARPQVQFEEAVMHHDQERAYYAGRTEWQPITLTWYDVEQDPDASKAIWDWVQGVSDIPQATVSTPRDYKKQTTVSMTDGQGEDTEKWTLYNTWPQDTNWSDLDYTSSELQVVEVKIRFDRAKRETA